MDDEGKLPRLILPNDRFWLLNLTASRDEPMPFHLLLAYHWQWNLANMPEPSLHGYIE